MLDCLHPHGAQHVWLSCPLLSPGVCSNLCPLNRWCHPTISSSVTLFSSCPQSFPALMFSSESAFCIKQPKSSSFSFSQSSQSSFLHQASRASALASVLPMSIQGWFPLGLTGLISLLSKGLSRVLFSTTVWKHQFFGTQPSFWHLAFLNVSLTKQT